MRARVQKISRTFYGLLFFGPSEGVFASLAAVLSMKLVFDVDLEKDNLDEKLKQLVGIESAIIDAKAYKARKEGENWLGLLPEKPFY